MKIFNRTRKSENIVLNSGEFIKSLDLSGSKTSDFVGYTLYLEILKGIRDLNESQNKASLYINELLRNSYGLSKINDCKKLVFRLNEEKRVVGNIEFTISSLIKRWMELQDDALLATFKETMNYSDVQIEQINNCLSPNELRFAENILFEFYKNYLMGQITGLSLNEITKEAFSLYYTNKIPYKKYSNIQFIDNHTWREDVFKYPLVPKSANEGEELEEEDKITKRLDDSWGDSIWEVGNRNWQFYDSEIKNKTLKYKILDVSLFESLDKYVSEIEAFKNLWHPKNEFLSVFDNLQTLNSIKTYHGDEKSEKMINLIEAIYDYNSSNKKTSIKR